MKKIVSIIIAFGVFSLGAAQAQQEAKPATDVAQAIEKLPPKLSGVWEWSSWSKDWNITIAKQAPDGTFSGTFTFWSFSHEYQITDAPITGRYDGKTLTFQGPGGINGHLERGGTRFLEGTVHTGASTVQAYLNR